jgi:hypothetical protein
VNDPKLDTKLLGLGRMIWDLITDIVVLPAQDAAYVRRTITFPDGRGGKGSIEVIVARKEVADAMEEVAGMRFGVIDVPVTKGQKPS